MSNPQLIIFDLAGTTVRDNKDVHRMLQRTLKSFGVEITIEDANRVMGIPKPVAIRSLLLQYGIVFEASKIDQIHRAFIENMIEFYQFDDEVTEFEGVTKLFQKLKKNGIKVAVDTGFDRKITNTLLARMEWEERGLIDASVTSDEVSQGRPFPDMIFKAMYLTGVTDVAAVIKVGDTVSDIQEGKSAGCGWVIGVTSGAGTYDELKAAQPTQLMAKATEVTNLFASLR